MEARKAIICGLPAKGIRPQLQTQQAQEVDDVVELSEYEYRRAMGYLIRVEEDEEDIEPEFKAVVQHFRNEELRIRNQELMNSAAMKRPKQEQGESSRKARRRD